MVRFTVARTVDYGDFWTGTVDGETFTRDGPRNSPRGLSGQFHPYPCDTAIQVLPKLVLPKADDVNSIRAECPGDLLMSSPVPVELRSPEGIVCLRHMPASGTPVPETSVDKNSEFLFCEVEIWFTGKRAFVANPSVDSTPDERHLKAEFRCFVTSTAYSCHCP